MKALTVKQPWAYLICSGIKDIENRTWKCPQKHIGQRVLIHASKSIELDHVPLSEIYTQDQLFALNERLTEYDLCTQKFVHSAIVGSVEIVGCTVNHQSIWAEKSEIGQDERTNEWIKPIYNWILANHVLFAKPILNVKGALSFWDYSNIHSELDDGRQVCMCNLGIEEKDQAISYVAEFRCRYCGGMWYK